MDRKNSVPCHYCHGNNKKIIYIPCPCHGDGSQNGPKNGPKPGPVPHCQKCNGTGRIIVMNRKCPHCIDGRIYY